MRRWYCRRRGLPPTAVVSRREALEEAAFADAESTGALPPDREEAVLAAIYYALGRLAAHVGVDMNDVERRVGDPYAIRPQRLEPVDPEDAARLDDEETRRDFAPILARAKAMLERK